MNHEKKSYRKKIISWISGVLIGIAIGAAVVGYFYWSRLIKVTLEEIATRSTKGLYRVEIKNLYYGIFTGKLYIRDVSLMLDTVVYAERKQTDSAPGMILSLHLDDLVVYDLELKRAIFHQEIAMGKAIIRGPDIKLTRVLPPRHDTLSAFRDTLLSIPLPKELKIISIKELTLQKGSFAYVDQTTDSLKNFSIPSFDILVKNFLVDSNWRVDPRIYNADDIHFALRGINIMTGNELYRLNFGEVTVSTKECMVEIGKFYLEPLYNRHDFSRKFGYQTDRMDIHIGTIRFSTIDWMELVVGNRLIAEKLLIDSLNLDDYRDKRLPMRPGFKPPMPQQLIRETKHYFWIDTVMITNGLVSYSEQVGSEPGTLFFDQVNGHLTGLTNDSTWLAEKRVSKVKACARIQGTGKIDADIDLVFGDTRNKFSLSARLGQFNLPAINPMLTKLLPAEIMSGTVQKMVIPFIGFNDDVSTGHLTLYYSNLNFQLQDTKQTAWSGIKTGVINWLADGNILISHDNPEPKGRLRTGIVRFERDKHKSILNFIWKSILSGVKSNMGFNTKAQKQIKKEKK